MIVFRNRLLAECISMRFRQVHLSCMSSRRGRQNEPNEESAEQLLENATVSDTVKAGDQMWLNKPYGRVRDQALKALRPKVNPQETSIILFPGQGVQYVGMGTPLLKIPEVKEMFKTASGILGYDLLKLCSEGPKRELDRTVHCQPAVFVASLAALQLMIEERRVSVESCVATAGFSVGEYAALVLANCISFEKGVSLVKQRAEIMQSVAEQVAGGMMTVFLDPAAKIGTILDTAREWCINNGVEKPVCAVANYLYPNCRVIGGNIEALKFIEQSSTDLKIRRCRRIPVSGAFHTALMKPAAEEFALVLRNHNINPPEISVHSNVDGLPYRDSQDIKKKLVKQIYLPVKWEQTQRILYDREKGSGFPQTFELGPGKSLTTLLKYANGPASKDAINILA